MFPSNDSASSNVEARVQADRLRYQNHPTSKSHSYGNEAWMRWEYGPDEWALFEKEDWFRPLLLCLAFNGGCLVAVMAAILPWFVLPPDTEVDPVLAVFLPAVLVWCVLISFAVGSLFACFDAWRRYNARQQGTHTVTFSREGVWEGGAFFPLNQFLEAELKKVRLTFDPPVLHFRVKRWHIGKYSNSSPTYSTLHIPIPRGQEEAAGYLQERYQTEVLKARVQQEKRWKNPPEPR